MVKCWISCQENFRQFFFEPLFVFFLAVLHEARVWFKSYFLHKDCILTLKSKLFVYPNAIW